MIIARCDGMIGTETWRSAAERLTRCSLYRRDGVNPTLYSKCLTMRCEFRSDHMVAASPLLIAAHPSVPARTIRSSSSSTGETRTLTYGTGGIGTGSHLTMELFN